MTATGTIFHDPCCGTSRNVLAMIRRSAVEPRIVDDLRTPPGHQQAVELLAAMGNTVHALLRRKGTPYDELKLVEPHGTDAQSLDAWCQNCISTCVGRCHAKATPTDR